MRGVSRLIVVRVPAGGWPGDGLAEALGDGFLVTASDQIVADVLVLTGCAVSEVRRLRKQQPSVGIVVHTTRDATVDMLTAGADIAVGADPLAEIAARIRAVARHLTLRGRQGR